MKIPRRNKKQRLVARTHAPSTNQQDLFPSESRAGELRNEAHVIRVDGIRVILTPYPEHPAKAESYVRQALTAFARMPDWLALIALNPGKVQTLEDGRLYVMTCRYSSGTSIEAEYEHKKKLLHLYLPVRQHWKAVGFVPWLDKRALR